LPTTCYCPHCGQGFPPENVLWIAAHPLLACDPHSATREPYRFRPQHFTPDADALDPQGAVCTRLACPKCLRELPPREVWLKSARSSPRESGPDLLPPRVSSRACVDVLLAALRSEVLNSTPAVMEAAARYADLCRDANARLQRCVEWLKRGARSEALRQADEPPPVLDLVSTLACAELRTWPETARFLGLAIPPPLNLDQATELNLALALEEPLRPTLDRFRRQALASTALPERLATLRELAQRDPSHWGWQEELRVYEEVRWRQISLDGADAAQRQDGPALRLLLQEATSPGWSGPTPVAVVEELQRHLHAADQFERRDKLGRITQQLQEAFSRQDVDLGRGLRDRWRTLVGEVQLAPHDDLLQQAHPALNWLDQQDRRAADYANFQQSVQALDQALAADEPRETLVRLYQALQTYSFPLPEDLAKRYQGRLRSFRQETYRFWGALAAIAVVLIVGAGAGWFYMQAREAHRHEVRTQAAALEDLMRKKLLAEALTFHANLTKNTPKIAEEAEVVGLKARLDAEIQSEADRAARFQTVLARATANGPTAADLPALDEARKLAVKDAEKEALAKFDAALAEQARLNQAERDQQFRKDFATIQVQAVLPEARLQQLEKQDAPPLDALDEIDKDVQKVRAGWQLLKLKHKKASAEALQVGPLLEAKMTNLSARIRGLRAETVAELALSRAVGHVGHYEEALRAYAEAFPATPRGAACAQALREIPLWLGLLRWNDWCAAWVREGVRLGPSDARIRVTRARELLQTHGDFPQAPALRRMLPYWDAVAARQADARKLTDRLEPLLAAELVNGPLWQLGMSNGRKYYLPKLPTYTGGLPTVTIRYYTNWSGATTTVTLERVRIVSELEAPQMALARDIAKRLPPLSMLARDPAAERAKTLWEQSLPELMKAIQRAETVDPVLRARFLREAVQLAIEGSHPLSHTLAEPQRMLFSPKLDVHVSWMDPDQFDADRARTAAKLTLDTLPDFVEAGQAALRELDVLEQPLAPEYLWKGWLRLDRKGTWTCVSSTALPASGTLWVVLRTSMNVVEITPIGDLSQGQTTWRYAATTLFTEGHPLFWTP